MCTISSTARAINRCTVIRRRAAIKRSAFIENTFLQSTLLHCTFTRSTLIKTLLVFTSSTLLLACSPSENDLTEADTTEGKAQAAHTTWETPEKSSVENTKITVDSTIKHAVKSQSAVVMDPNWVVPSEDQYIYVKTQTPIAELQAYAKEAALKRSELRLAKDEPAARKQYLEALTHLENKDYAEAEALLVALSEQGYADVQMDLKTFYNPTDSDKPEAYQSAEKTYYWLKQALAQGFADAQYTYALWHYSDQYSVERDWGKYVDWLIIASEQGHADAQRELGFAYASGRGVELNLIESYKWHELAIRRFNPPPKDKAKNTIAVRINLARSLQSKLISRQGMTPEQVATAKRLVDEWEASHPYAYQSINDIEHIIYRRP